MMSTSEPEKPYHYESGALPKLQFPEYEFRIAEENGSKRVFDPARRRYVALTPEEWVRQHIILYLHKDKKYPIGLMMVEHEFKYNKLSRRADVVVCDRTGAPLLMVECKSPEVKIDRLVFDQVMRYNLKMQVKTVVLTNGLKHFCFTLDEVKLQYVALKEIPIYSPKRSRSL